MKASPASKFLAAAALAGSWGLVAAGAGASVAPSAPAAATPDIMHPAIRTHPITGRKCVYVNQTYTFGLEGMTEEQSQPLLERLYAHITRPDLVYRHKWQVGDLLMWDNCLTQHKAIADYALPLRRLMYRTAIEGTVPF